MHIWSVSLLMIYLLTHYLSRINMSILIRKVLPSDNQQLAIIIRSCFHDFLVKNKNGTVYTDPTTDDLFALFQNPKSLLWVAEVEGEIMGCCGLFPTENLPNGHTELVKFYLAKKARGKGIGRLLLEKTIASAQDMGYTHLYLESIPEFSTAVSIYEKQGFEYLHQPLGESGHDGCNLWMVKALG